MKNMLLLSSEESGGVPFFSKMLRELGYRPFLVTDHPNDRHRHHCDDWVTFDWKTGTMDALGAALAQKGITPVGVINAREALIGWQLSILQHFELPCANREGLQVLQSKYNFRQALNRHGVERLRFRGGPIGELRASDVDFFPCMIKPARDSGFSKLVARTDDAEALARRIDFLRSLDPSGRTEYIIEEYMPGIEFSFDGMVVDGEFHGLFLVEKVAFDYEHHHDGKWLASPPVNISRPVQDAIHEHCKAACRAVQVKNLWLHIEGRLGPDGSVGIIEFNPRVGGSQYASALKCVTGIDPIVAMLKLWLTDEVPYRPELPPPNQKPVLMAKFTARGIGRVVPHVSLQEMLALPHVYSGMIREDLVITTLEQEHCFAAFTLSGASHEELLRGAEEIERRLQFHIA